MAKDTSSDIEIHGDVKKLTTIGTVQGDVFIVNDDVIKSQFITTDITSYIKLIVKSNRFGRKVSLRVPHEMNIRAFINLVVDTLDLPWSRSINELMVSFRFTYSIIFTGKKIPLNQTLLEAGLTDGSEIELSVYARLTDEIKKQEMEEAKGEFMYDMISRTRELSRREEVQKVRGKITRTKIREWANGFFSHIDELETS